MQRSKPTAAAAAANKPANQRVRATYAPKFASSRQAAAYTRGSKSVNGNAGRRGGAVKKPVEEVKVVEVLKSPYQLAIERSDNIVAACGETMKRSNETQERIRAVSASCNTAIAKFEHIKNLKSKIDAKMNSMFDQAQGQAGRR